MNEKAIGDAWDYVPDSHVSKGYVLSKEGYSKTVSYNTVFGKENQ